MKVPKFIVHFMENELQLYHTVKNTTQSQQQTDTNVRCHVNAATETRFTNLQEGARMRYSGSRVDEESVLRFSGSVWIRWRSSESLCCSWIKLTERR